MNMIGTNVFNFWSIRVYDHQALHTNMFMWVEQGILISHSSLDNYTIFILIEVHVILENLLRWVLYAPRIGLPCELVT
jgi:hypothetical protein